MSTETVPIADARRIALAAQGFGLAGVRARSSSGPSSSADIARGVAVFGRVGVVQVDSVNVVVRSQELPLLARLGAHPRDLLPRMLDRGLLFEYWGHEASLLPMSLQPHFRWRMEEARSGEAWRGLVRFAAAHPEFVEAVVAEVAARGPLRAAQLSDPGERGGPWWGWNNGKRALEYLFWCGRLMARRTSTFERVYDLPERMLPPETVATPTPDKADAQRALVDVAGRAQGVATVADLADYFRMRPAVVRARTLELVEAGTCVPVRVEGWRDEAYLWDVANDMTIRRRAAALLSPFDSLVWNRARTERLFGFRYRIEIYTPAPQRVHGYYVLPFLHEEGLVARVDLKADRKAGVLRALAVHAEPSTSSMPSRRRRSMVAALALRLGEMAGWLGLGGVAVHERGDLAGPVRAEIEPT